MKKHHQQPIPKSLRLDYMVDRLEAGETVAAVAQALCVSKQAVSGQIQKYPHVQEAYRKGIDVRKHQQQRILTQQHHDLTTLATACSTHAELATAAGLTMGQLQSLFTRFKRHALPSLEFKERSTDSPKMLAFFAFLETHIQTDQPFLRRELADKFSVSLATLAMWLAKANQRGIPIPPSSGTVRVQQARRLHDAVYADAHRFCFAADIRKRHRLSHAELRAIIKATGIRNLPVNLHHGSQIIYEHILSSTDPLAYMQSLSSSAKESCERLIRRAVAHDWPMNDAMRSVIKDPNLLFPRARSLNKRRAEQRQAYLSILDKAAQKRHTRA